jgi:hypothetical protein
MAAAHPSIGAAALKKRLEEEYHIKLSYEPTQREVG